MGLFEDVFSQRAVKRMLEFLGESATYTTAAGSASTITTVYNEQVGFIDDRSRATFLVDPDDVAAPARGDYIVLAGETTRWIVTDVRDDKSGAFELRCDSTLERL